MQHHETQLQEKLRAGKYPLFADPDAYLDEKRPPSMFWIWGCWQYFEALTCV